MNMIIKGQLFKDTLGWGILLWLFGYVLGIVLFMIVPPSTIGWIIMPFGSLLTIWILFNKIKSTALPYYLFLAAGWTIMAAVLDYIFLVRLLKPDDGYYKMDVYLYYALTFLLPIIAGWKKKQKLISE